MDFRTEIFPPEAFIAMAQAGPYPAIGATWEKLFQIAGPMGWVGPDTKVIGLFLDDPREVPEDKLRSNACISKPAGFVGHDGMEELEIGGGRFLIGTFVGAFDGLPEAWGVVTQEASKHDVREADPCFERYVVHDQDHPERCVTEIYIPIN